MKKRCKSTKKLLVFLTIHQKTILNHPSLFFQSSLNHFPNIFVHFVNYRRRDAYYKVLSRMGYDWGRIDKEKCIMKTYKKSDINPDIMENENG